MNPGYQGVGANRRRSWLMDSSRDQARLAGAAALISAGAAAVSLLRAGSRNAAPASAPAGDAGLVGLIERVADATNRASTADDALLACVQQVCRWTGWPVGHVYFVEHDTPCRRRCGT